MTVDRNGNVIRYGITNKDLVLGWMKMPAEEDGPFWALNLMKYREVADYGAVGGATKTGRQADDEYTPRDSLAGIGARIVFAADVERTLAGDSVEWDRIGIVRYPSRKAFFEMQQREDFKKSHVHKDAGMEFTIVMSCLPSAPFTGAPNRHPWLELTVTGGPVPTAVEDGVGVFEVEGVIVGDSRAWNHAAFRWLAEAPDASERVDDDATYRLLLRPTIDHLTASVLES
jgi:hypothetical protein